MGTALVCQTVSSTCQRLGKTLHEHSGLGTEISARLTEVAVPSHGDGPSAPTRWPETRIIHTTASPVFSIDWISPPFMFYTNQSIRDEIIAKDICREQWPSFPLPCGHRTAPGWWISRRHSANVPSHRSQPRNSVHRRDCDRGMASFFPKFSLRLSLPSLPLLPSSLPHPPYFCPSAVCSSLGMTRGVAPLILWGRLV
ncbi:hypothetical protein BDP81DRAFT_419365 [Colletotrichum phormii]|uniref:Uncharacterized protein n=1 Tax=Colletotrichum phormii TaxID=359342 RepID=A0AAJ0EKK3_9PEZI|nr:uncharacterized protein BDP81DRAFT_419365 [Colletotrichum phormii]KAK1640106.1 hypothetical protein BDP81DRAFT_419365 [Colletotrichum phormii]